MSPKILVTGGNGMIGSALVNILRKKYGKDNVIAADIRREGANPIEDPFEFCDVTQFAQLEAVVVAYKIDWIVNMCAILSIAGENNPQLAIQVNMIGFQNLMEVARLHKLRIFSPSTIAAFGPSTPKELTPDVTIMRPTNIYGVTKVHNELVGEYYQRKYGVDFRCLRFPSIITDEGEGRGRFVDYIVEIFVKALTIGSYTCDVAEDARLPFLYLQDCIEGTVKFMEVPEDQLKQRVYNITAMSITPGEIAVEVRKCVPDFKIDYAPDPAKMAIINTLPVSFDDSNARRDWAWAPQYDLQKVVPEMITRLKAKLNTAK